MTTRREPLGTPVLFLLFNRPELTRRVFAAIREARPARLYVAADGPRPDRPGEDALCREAREVLGQVDWDCQVRTLLRDENHGCKAAVAGAISWFFGHEAEGIILEDDCLPGPDFFPFCAELLARFRHDPRVMTISGNNFQGGAAPTAPTCPTGPAGQSCREYAYYFSRHPHVWGWATWRRAWDLYDPDMALWPEFRDSGRLLDVFGRRVSQAYWTRILDETHDGRFVTWDYQWMLASWANSGLTVIPRANLVANLGFDARATHTVSPTPYANLSAGRLEFPLEHPPCVLPDAAADRRIEFVRLLFHEVDWLAGDTVRLIFSLRDAGRHDEALAALAEILEHFPGNLELQRTRGGLLAAAGRRMEAVALFTELFAARPDHPDLLLNACDALRHEGLLDEALALFREVQALAPGLPGLAEGERRILDAMARSGRVQSP